MYFSFYFKVDFLKSSSLNRKRVPVPRKNPEGGLNQPPWQTLSSSAATFSDKTLGFALFWLLFCFWSNKVQPNKNLPTNTDSELESGRDLHLKTTQKNLWVYGKADRGSSWVCVKGSRMIHCGSDGGGGGGGDHCFQLLRIQLQVDEDFYWTDGLLWSL